MVETQSERHLNNLIDQYTTQNYDKEYKILKNSVQPPQNFEEFSSYETSMTMETIGKQMFENERQLDFSLQEYYTQYSQGVIKFYYKR